MKLYSCKNCCVIEHKMKKCSACKVARYCSVSCQRADWARHRLYCSAAFACPNNTDPNAVSDSNPESETETDSESDYEYYSDSEPDTEPDTDPEQVD